MKGKGHWLLATSVALLLAAGCQGKGGMVKTEGEIPAGESLKLSSLLPTSSELVRWRSPVLKVYNPDNLFEYIDGEAQAFLGYDFRELLSARYAYSASSRQTAIIDIYDMGNPDNAFGIYSSRRGPDAKFLLVGAQGFVAEGRLEFWKSRFFVDVKLYGQEKGADEEAARLARLVAVRIPASADRPALTALLPGEHQSPNTLVYYRRNVLGYGFLENGMQAAYGSGDEFWELLLCKFGSREAASKAFLKLKDEWSRMADFKGQREHLGEEAFTLQDSYFGTVIVFRKGSFIGIGLRVEEQEALRSLTQLAALATGEK